MWLATRHEGFDRAKGSLKCSSDIKKPNLIFIILSKRLLRSGLISKLLSLFLLIFSHYAYGGLGVFDWNLSASTEEMRANSVYRKLVLLGFSGLMLGAIYICSFQCTLADDAAWSRGYRAGSKILAYASIFDLVSSAIQLAWVYNFYLNYNNNYWVYFNSGNIDWIFSAASRALHGITMLLYGFAFFLLEIYHDEGTNDWHGILNLFVFSTAGLIELGVLVLMNSKMSIILTLIALISGFTWALAFEDEVNLTSPALNESELCNELEREIDDFTCQNPMNI